jgi:endoglucanase
LYSLVFHRAKLGNAIDTNFAVSALLNLRPEFENEVATSAYHVVMGESNGNFVWGSNAIAANQGMALIQAYKLTGEVSFLEAAIQNLDYLLGRNAVGYCFVTGLGSKSPMRIHHRQSEADGIVDPVPGLLAGGPNANARTDDGGNCSGYLGTERAKSYVDALCSYASNEIAINWNAPRLSCRRDRGLYSPTGKPTDRGSGGKKWEGSGRVWPAAKLSQPFQSYYADNLLIARPRRSTPWRL